MTTINNRRKNAAAATAIKRTKPEEGPNEEQKAERPKEQEATVTPLSYSASDTVRESTRRRAAADEAAARRHFEQRVFLPIVAKQDDVRAAIADSAEARSQVFLPIVIKAPSRNEQILAQAEEIARDAEAGLAPQAAQDLADAMESMTAAEQELMIERIATEHEGAMAQILRHTYPSAPPPSDRPAIPQTMGRLFDAGRLTRANLDEILSPLNSTPHGQAYPIDPGPAAQVLADSGSAAMSAEVAASLLDRATTQLPETAARYDDAALAQGAGAIAVAFQRNPARAEQFADRATSAQLQRLFGEVNADPARFSEAELVPLDEVFKRSNEAPVTADLQREFDRYLLDHVDRAAFVETAFVEDLRAGDISDEHRDRLHRQFAPLGLDASHTVMDAIRGAGQLDHFLDASLRDEDGGAVNTTLRGGVRRLMETGRLDAYAETLTSTSFNIHDPATSGREANPHFNPGDNAIYFDQTKPPISNANTEGLAHTLAHETYHAFAHAHGGIRGSMDEGFGIAAIPYAFSNDTYSISEAVYGTKNFYRDRSPNPDPNFPLGFYEHADEKLTEFMTELGTRDHSELRWQNNIHFGGDYEFWRPYNRFEDLNANGETDWSEPGGYADQAEANMLADRNGGPHASSGAKSSGERLSDIWLQYFGALMHLALLIPVLLAACGSPSMPSTPPPPPPIADAGVAPEPDAGAMLFTGCADACGACSAAEHEVRECVVRCEYGGVLDDQITGRDQRARFLACRSEDRCDPACDAILGLGALSTYCDELCTCFGEATRAERSIFVRTPAMSIDYLRELGARAKTFGALTLLQLDRPLTPADRDRFAAALEVLPTFIDGAGRPIAATNRLIVRASKSFADRDARRLSYTAGLSIITARDPWQAVAEKAKLAALGVEVEHDFIRPYTRRAAPNDPRIADQWHLESRGSAESIAGVDARVLEAFELTQGSPDVVIAVLDDGVDLDHPDLAPNLLPPLNFPENWREIPGFGWHGTQVAGVIAAAANNAEGGAGACPSCKILPAVFPQAMPEMEPDYGTINLGIADSELAQLFVDLADRGAWIISNSWGPPDGEIDVVEAPAEPLVLPEVIRAAFEYASTRGRGGKGTVILFAAGNGNELIDGDPLSASPSVIAVGALGDQGLKAPYSDFGDALDVVAPSSGGLRGIFTTHSQYVPPQERYTEHFGGTSSACPLAAGVVGLMLSANTDLSASEARELLGASASRIDPQHGEWDAEGRSIYYGRGLIDAYRAVKMALGCARGSPECEAPSDRCAGGSCGEGACTSCRIGRPCSEGFVCQPLPSLGRATCVELAGPAGCPMGTSAQGGLCIPDRATCGWCASEELCNGRDDDCDGAFDEDLDCKHAMIDAPLCIPGVTDCGPDRYCSNGGFCTAACTGDTSCLWGACAEATDAFGRAIAGYEACRTDDAQVDRAFCSLVCQGAYTGAAAGIRGEADACANAHGATCAELTGACSMKIDLGM